MVPAGLPAKTRVPSAAIDSTLWPVPSKVVLGFRVTGSLSPVFTGVGVKAGGLPPGALASACGALSAIDWSSARKQRVTCSCTCGVSREGGYDVSSVGRKATTYECRKESNRGDNRRVAFPSLVDRLSGSTVGALRTRRHLQAKVCKPQRVTTQVSWCRSW